MTSAALAAQLMGHAETAQTMEISEGAASKRYVRALKRLRTVLSSVPGGLLE